MAIVVEDGTGLSTANSYISEAELTTYATNRGVTISGTNSELIYKAMDYLESFKFIGVKYSKAQALQFPRVGVVIDRFVIDYNEIPQLLKDAQAEICLSIDSGDNPLENQTRETKSEKVDVITVEYTDTARASVYLTAAHAKLDKLIDESTGIIRV